MTESLDRHRIYEPDAHGINLPTQYHHSGAPVMLPHVTGWPANPNLVRHLKSTLIWTGVHVDEAVMGLSVHTDKDGERSEEATTPYYSCKSYISK